MKSSSQALLTSSLVAAGLVLIGVARDTLPARAASTACPAGQYMTSTGFPPQSCAQVQPSQLAIGALPNGTTATTQALNDNTAKVATDQFVQNQFNASGTKFALALSWDTRSRAVHANELGRTGIANAAAAQTTANTALANAATAQATANTATKLALSYLGGL